MTVLTFTLDEFYELPYTLQEDFIYNKTIVIREWIVNIFLDEKEYEKTDIENLF